MSYYKLSTQQTFEKLKTAQDGLTRKEAEKRLAHYGQNALTVKGTPLWRKILEPFFDIFTVVLLVAIVISLLQRHHLDAMLIGIIIFINAIIYWGQTYSSERILRSLKKHTIESIKVHRSGVIVDIPSTLIVPGDIIFLSEGKKVPADARIITAQNVGVDESLLTGESISVLKNNKTIHRDREIYDRRNMLFSGSFIVNGEVTAVVVGTGNETEFGKIASLTKNNPTLSPGQIKIDKLISKIVIAVGIMSVLAFILSFSRGQSLADSINFTLALAVSAVPEALPVVISVILALGMKRIAKQKALVTNMRAIETVGLLTTIATDKTGTLTKNKLSVQEYWQAIKGKNNFEATVIKTVIGGGGVKPNDPLDVALQSFSKKALVSKGRPFAPPVESLPFDQTFAMSGNVYHYGEKYQLFVKGAPEKILHHAKISESQREEVKTMLHAYTSQGYRVLAVASCTMEDKITKFRQLPKGPILELIGLLAVADGLRPEAKKSIKEAQAAGVSVRMITGDHFETAFQIGKELNLVESRDQVFNCEHLTGVNNAKLEKIIDKTFIFSRVTPEAKLRILSILKKKNITAMTGDGVNDVPALANANVGIAMGSGDAIAKDASDIILLDNNFKNIISAMKEGRIIFANIRRMLYYLISTNTGEVITFLGALIIGLGTPLLPIQILWINLVTDGLLVIGLGLEPGEKYIMKNKPLKINAPILSKTMLIRMCLIALTISSITLSTFIIFTSLGYSVEYARTLAFLALVITQWSIAFTARSDKEPLFKRLKIKNNAFYVGLLLSVILQAIVLFGPLQGPLHIAPVAFSDMIMVTAIAFSLPLIVAEAHKFISIKKK